MPRNLFVALQRLAEGNMFSEYVNTVFNVHFLSRILQQKSPSHPHQAYSFLIIVRPSKHALAASSFDLGPSLPTTFVSSERSVAAVAFSPIRHALLQTQHFGLLTTTCIFYQRIVPIKQSKLFPVVALFRAMFAWQQPSSLAISGSCAIPVPPLLRLLCSTCLPSSHTFCVDYIMFLSHSFRKALFSC